MGGSNDLANLVNLSARQHYVAHRLLWKALRNREAARGFFFVSHRAKSREKISSRVYKELKEGMSMSDDTKAKLSIAFKGRKRLAFTAETKAKISLARTGIVFSTETKAKMSQSAKTRKSRVCTEESRQKMREASIKREAQKKEAGYVISEETRVKLSLASKGREVSSETRAKLSNAAMKQHACASQAVAKHSCQ